MAHHTRINNNNGSGNSSTYQQGSCVSRAEFHLHEVPGWIETHFPMVVFYLGAIAGGLTWAFKQVLTSHTSKAIAASEARIISKLEQHEVEAALRIEKYIRSNSEEHMNIVKMLVDHIGQKE